jgi:hypothetical protein
VTQTPPILITPVNAMGVAAELDLPVTCYRVLLMMMERQQSGGQVVMPQHQLGELLSISRSSITVALGHLDAAHMVKMVSYGVYQLNPMIAGYPDVATALDAIEAMPAEERLDEDDVAQRYQTRLAAQKAERHRRRMQGQLKAVS